MYFKNLKIYLVLLFISLAYACQNGNNEPEISLDQLYLESKSNFQQLTNEMKSRGLNFSDTKEVDRLVVKMFPELNSSSFSGKQTISRS